MSTATVEQRNGKWLVIYGTAIVGRYAAKYKALEHAAKLNG